MNRMESINGLPSSRGDGFNSQTEASQAQRTYAFKKANRQIANSIKQFGWTYPILADEHKHVIAGVGRLQASHSLGLREVPVIMMTGLTDAQKRALALAD